MLVDRVRRADLNHAGPVHHRDPVGHGKRLALVVGDIDRGDAERLLELLDPVFHLLAELLVERAQGLVEQQDLGLDDQHPGERDPLLLAAGELPLIAPLVAAEIHLIERPLHAHPNLPPRRLPYLQAERDIVEHIHVRKDRVVLKDDPDSPLLRRQQRHVLAADQHPAVIGADEARDHAQCRRLAAARRAEQGEELALLDPQAQVIDRERLAVALSQVRELDVRHAVPRSRSRA